MAWLAKLECEEWSFRFVLIDVIDKTELTEWTEFRLVNCQRLDSAGVIHRDIKPANLMIDADEKIHVMDFGLAKVADDHSLTATGDLLGTLRYMPPESFQVEPIIAATSIALV